MDLLLNIRAITGLGQESIASFLGLTRQALAKAERGVCSLSNDNLIKLCRLHAYIEQFTAEDVKQGSIPGPVDLRQEHSREKECRYFIAVCKNKLAKQEELFKKCMIIYRAVCTMQAADEGESLWIQKMKNEITNKLDKCGSAACMRLRKRIYLLTAEAEYIRRLVNEIQIQP